MPKTIVLQNNQSALVFTELSNGTVMPSLVPPEELDMTKPCPAQLGEAIALFWLTGSQDGIAGSMLHLVISCFNKVTELMANGHKPTQEELNTVVGKSLSQDRVEFKES